jgi:hypothetical protein
VYAANSRISVAKGCAIAPNLTANDQGLLNTDCHHGSGPIPTYGIPFYSIAGYYHGKERLHHHNNDFGLFERIIKNLFSCLLVSCMRDHFFCMANYAICFQHPTSREEINASLRAFHRRK